MSSKLKRHQKWNVTKTEMLPNFKMSSKLKSKSKSRRLALITLVLFWGKLLRYKNYQHKKIYLLTVNFDRVTAIFGNLFSLFFCNFSAIFCSFWHILEIKLLWNFGGSSGGTRPTHTIFLALACEVWPSYPNFWHFLVIKTCWNFEVQDLPTN